MVIVSSEVQLLKVEPKLIPVLETESGNLTSVRFLQFTHMFSIVFNLDAADWKTILLSELQVLNVPVHVLGLNPLGNTICFKFVQDWKREVAL